MWYVGPYLFFDCPDSACTVLKCGPGGRGDWTFQAKEKCCTSSSPSRTCLTFSLSPNLSTQCSLAVALTGLHCKPSLPDTLLLVIRETYSMNLYLIRKVNGPTNDISLNTSKSSHSVCLFVLKKAKTKWKSIRGLGERNFHCLILFPFSLLETMSSFPKSCKYHTKNFFLLWATGV